MASTLTNSPCAACKFLRRKCMSECVFAPYFPPEEPQKFANVHKIFGASNVTKLLNELPPHQREDAVNSLAYEAEARLKDPVYGCVGAISLLQRQVLILEKELAAAQTHLLHFRRYTTCFPLPLPLPLPAPLDSAAQLPPHLTREQLLQLAIGMGIGESGSAVEMGDGVALRLQGQGQLYPFPSPSPTSGSGSSGGSLGHTSPP